jgi:NAD(P)-dependent dehydrogenase (short-subunit alcohol dehydrogenase family)
MRFGGRTVIVTGAGSGFGRTTAVRFSSEGAAVVVGDVDEAGGAVTVEEIAAGGGRAALVVGDVATAEGAQALVDRAVSAFGSVDVLVNNAGIAQGGALGETWNLSEERWDHTIRVNLKSVYLCSRAAIPVMLAQGRGSIVSVASIAATRAVAGAAYAATKGGILSYTRQVSQELAARGIRLNCVSPGYMRTPMSTGERLGLTPEQQEDRIAAFGALVPMGRAGSTLDIAEAILFLASDEAGYITGQELVVDGGYLVG